MKGAPTISTPPRGTADAALRQPLTYRADIDGLRGIAVLAVVAFHAAESVLPGGFAGVDVFFVISGYLISSIVLTGLAEQRYSTIEFYVRRVKRIFPALLTMFAVVSIYGWFVLFPSEYQQLGKHIAAGAGFVSNWVFWSEAGYFDVASEQKPLLHLWSLGIEEQFYLVWPLFLWLTWRARRFQFALLLLITLASFIANLYTVRQFDTTAFYMPWTRIWELSMGGALAYAQLFAVGRLKDEAAVPPAPRWPRLLRLALHPNVCAALGVCLVALSFVKLDRQTTFPGWWAAVPALGALLLIAGGKDAWLNRRILSWRPLVAVGLISYPLYLWHWPLLSIARTVEWIHFDAYFAGGAVALAFVLSVLTYRYIERPVRSARNSTAPVLPLALFMLMLVSGFTGYLVSRDTIPARSAAYGADRFKRDPKEYDYERNLQPLGKYANEDLRFQGSNPRQVLFIGDSNLYQYHPRVDELIATHPARARTAVYGGRPACAPISGFGHLPFCEPALQHATDYAKHPNVEAVVIGAHWYLHFLDPAFGGGIPVGRRDEALAAFEQMVRTFVAEGKQVYIILQIPVGPRVEPEQMLRRSVFQWRFVLDTRPLDRAEIARAIEPIVSRLTDIARRTGAVTIDPLETLCGPTTCPLLSPDGNPIYFDLAHLRASFVRRYIHFLDGIILGQQSINE